MILFFVGLVCTAVFFRDIYNLSKDKTIHCNKVADFVDEDEYDGFSGFCNGKYLDANKTCRKIDLYNRWESKNNELRSLNPVCCPVSNDIFVWPFYICAIWMLFMSLCMGLAAVSNLGLSYFSHEHDDYYKQLNFFDIITMGTIVLLALGIGLWLFFRSTPDFDNRFNS